MKKTVKACLCALIAFSLIFSGCTPHKALKELSIVEGFGIDKDGGGNFLTTYQIYKPQSGGGGEGKQSGGKSVTVVQSSGKSLFDAARNATVQMGKELYFSNNRSLVLGKDVCADGISSVIDYLERNHQIKPGQRVFMAQGKASDILNAKDEDGIIPAENLELISQNNLYTSKVADQQLSDIFKAVSSVGSEIYLPVVSKKKDAAVSGSSSASSGSSSGGSDSEILQVRQTAFFHDGKLAGFLTPEETRGLLWIEGKVRSGSIVVSTPKVGKINLEIIREKTNMSTSMENGKAVVSVDVSFRSRITEVDSKSVDDIDDETLGTLTGLQNQVVGNEVKSSVETALTNRNSDIFGFGEKIYESMPEIWRRLSKDWKNSSGQTKVNISVDSQISHEGLINR